MSKVSARPAEAPTRGRRNVPGAERKRQILRAAAELFAAAGYTGTTTRQIASAVGISETLLFRHFPSKETLYAASLEDMLPASLVDKWIGQLAEVARRDDDEGVFVAVARAVVDSYRGSPAFHRLMLYAALESHQLARRFGQAYSAPIGRFLGDYVARRQRAGAFKPLPPALVVHALFSVPSQYGQWEALGVGVEGVSDADVVNFARTLLDAVRVRPTMKRAPSARVARPRRRRSRAK